jgi:transcriptional regulator with XRE-family HTH domain
MGNGSLIERRQLAKRLRSLRERAGITQEAAAPALDWSVSKLSRIENAQQPVDVHGLRSVLDLYRAGGGTWTEMVDLCREARHRGWWRACGLGDDSYVGFETAAVRVDEYISTSVPGLLQTSEYARALFTDSAIRRTRAELRNQGGG